jgi:hypothetical protein
MHFSKIRQEIGSKYKKKKDQKIAEKCLQLGEEWTRIVSGGFADFNRFKVPAGADPKKYKRELAKECKLYIKDSLSEDDVKSYFPVVWIVPFVVQIFLGTVISWIARRLLDDLFEKNNEV